MILRVNLLRWRTWILWGCLSMLGAMLLVVRADSPDASAIRNGPNHSLDNDDLIAAIHQRIVDKASSAENAMTAEGSMKSYTETIPQTGVTFEMIAIPSGSFSMGSTDEDRSDNDGPRVDVTSVDVTISPFWMGKCEVTWDEYEPFMITQRDREKHGGWKDYDPQIHDAVDGVSQPTKPYTEMSFGMGQAGFPACCMTQHAANKYCQWLSAQTGHFYRLPTEAEWEYACRAGTNTAYSFGDADLEDHAWFYDNSDDKYQPVGTKAPNPWGLHDMHGNVMEWTADRYTEDYLRFIADDPINPWVRPEKLYPRSVRGGSWYDDPEQLRSSYRRGSEESWKQQDPQLPKSLWYHTDATWLGFRIVRPVETPDVEQMNAFWNSATNARR